MGFLLFIISLVLSLFLIPCGIVYALFYYILSAYYKGFNKYFKDLAISIDQFGNVAMSPLFNLILIKKHSIKKFGNVDETISSVMGKNQQLGTLAFLGRGVNNILQFLDYNHSVKSIEQNETNK